MGKFVGTIHQHDMPDTVRGKDADKVWECSCGELFYVKPETGTWWPVDKKSDIVTYDEEKHDV